MALSAALPTAIQFGNFRFMVLQLRLRPRHRLHRAQQVAAEAEHFPPAERLIIFPLRMEMIPERARKHKALQPRGRHYPNSIHFLAVYSPVTRWRSSGVILST